MRDDVLELEARRRVYQAIVNGPGRHLRDLERELAIGVGALRYHIDRLEQAGLIDEEPDARYLRYFAKEVPEPLRRLITPLRAQSARRIVTELLAHPGSTPRDLSDATHLGVAAVQGYLRELQRRGMLSKTREGGATRYLVVDATAVVDALTAYRRSFLDAALDAALAIWFEAQSEAKEARPKESGTDEAANP
ncbi:MAG: winged helix-turn-helix transcriptional regulator [Thermoplasmatota archaeon]